MKDQSPWFKFYPDKWLSSVEVTGMTAEERGAYIHLLSLGWRDDGIKESELDKISRYLKVDLKCTLSVLKRCFECLDGVWRNSLQEELRCAKNKAREAASRGGKNKSTSSPHQVSGKSTSSIREVEVDLDVETKKNKDFKTLVENIFSTLVTVVKCQKTYGEVLRILQYWNEHNNLQHHRVTKELLKELKKARDKKAFLSEYEINCAIDNYDGAKDDHDKNPAKNHWYAWTLLTFLNGGKMVTEFVNDNPWRKV